MVSKPRVLVGCLLPCCVDRRKKRILQVAPFPNAEARKPPAKRAGYVKARRMSVGGGVTASFHFWNQLELLASQCGIYGMLA